MNRSFCSKYILLSLGLLLALGALVIALPSRAGSDKFGVEPLLFVSERGDLHLHATHARSNFLHNAASETYKYGERQANGDILVNGDDFYKMLDESRQKNAGAPIILFVHGCCVGFGEQLLQANNLKKAIDKSYAGSQAQATAPGTMPVLVDYDWVAPFYYKSSIDNAITAQERFNSFMKQFTARYGSQNIVIVAHSLGTSLVQNYAIQIDSTDPSRSIQPFKAIVFSRADVDGASFSNCLDALKSHSKRLMAISASNDPNMFCSSLLRKLGIKFARAATFPAKFATGGRPSETVNDNDEDDKHLNHRLGQVKVARVFGPSIEVYDCSSLHLAHVIPYDFIGDILFNNGANFNLQKDDFGVLVIHRARP